MNNPTPEIIEEWNNWVASRPPSVKAIAERFSPFIFYRLKTTGQKVSLYSIFEDGTIKVIVHNGILPPYLVFGINPEDLEPFDE